MYGTNTGPGKMPASYRASFTVRLQSTLGVLKSPRVFLFLVPVVVPDWKRQFSTVSTIVRRHDMFGTSLYLFFILIWRSHRLTEHGLLLPGNNAF
jgi:hypothetical protein